MPEPESVAVFWDYENCALPATVAANAVVNNIRKLAHKYGGVKSFKAYAELPEQPSPKNIALRSDLQLCGVSVIDCPHNGGKDVADKMMIVDMMAFAIDTPAPATIVLISGDRDFVYAVSILSLRQYQLVVLAPHAAHISLKAQATVVYAWPGDVLPKPVAHRVSVSGNSAADPTGSANPGPGRAVFESPRPSHGPASPPPSPTVQRKAVSEWTPLFAGAARAAAPSWVLPDSTGTHPNKADSGNLVDTPSSDATAVDSDPELLRDGSDAQSTGSSSDSDDGIPPRLTWGSLLSSASARETTPEESWEPSLERLADLELNPRAPEFKREAVPAAPSVPVSFDPTPEPHTSLLPTVPMHFRAIAPHFKPLVKVLRLQRKQYIVKVDYSCLGTLLRQEAPNLYERAGVTKLKEYIALAQEARIVVSEENLRGPGGTDGQRWVSLHPRLVHGGQAKVQASLDDWVYMAREGSSK